MEKIQIELRGVSDEEVSDFISKTNEERSASIAEIVKVVRDGVQQLNDALACHKTAMIANNLVLRVVLYSTETKDGLVDAIIGVVKEECNGHR